MVSVTETYIIMAKGRQTIKMHVHKGDGLKVAAQTKLGGSGSYHTVVKAKVHKQQNKK